MAQRRRRTQWIDSIEANEFAIDGAAAPGTIVNTPIVSEAEFENLGGGGTLIRVIGDIFTRRTQGVAPVFTHTLFLSQEFVGSSASPTDWVEDSFQRMSMLGTWLGMVATDALLYRLTVDLRTKRKVMQGVRLILSSQNHSVATNDVAVAFHLRALILLP